MAFIMGFWASGPSDKSHRFRVTLNLCHMTKVGLVLQRLCKAGSGYLSHKGSDSWLLKAA